MRRRVSGLRHRCWHVLVALHLWLIVTITIIIQAAIVGYVVVVRDVVSNGAMENSSDGARVRLCFEATKFAILVQRIERLQLAEHDEPGHEE